MKVGGGTNAGAKRRKKFFSVPPHFSVVPAPPPVWGALHTPGWAQIWAVIAHCLFVKKWPVAETETKIQ